MSVRCDLTDLLVGECACRQHRGGADVVREPVSTVGQPFSARFAGECGACGGRIVEGDQIARAADPGAGYVHADQGRCLP